MNYISPRSSKPCVLQAFNSSSISDYKQLADVLDANFEAMFAPTDLEINLLGGWSAIAYEPQRANSYPSWAYKIFHHDNLCDYGLINWRYPAAKADINRKQQRQVINFLTDITQCYRDRGDIPRQYGTSLMVKNLTQ